MGVSSALLARVTTTDSSFDTFVVPLIISGIGIVTLYIPLSIAVLSATTPEQGPKASAFLNLAFQLGGSAGIAVLTVFVDQREAFHSTILAGAATLSGLSHRGFSATSEQVRRLAGQIGAQSTVLSYADASYFIAVLGVICIPLVFLLRRPKAAPRILEISE